MTYDPKHDVAICGLCGKTGRDHTWVEWERHRRIHGETPCPTCAALNERMTVEGIAETLERYMGMREAGRNAARAVIDYLKGVKG